MTTSINIIYLNIILGKILKTIVLQKNYLYIFNILFNVLQLITIVDNSSADSSDTYTSYPIPNSKSKLKMN